MSTSERRNADQDSPPKSNRSRLGLGMAPPMRWILASLCLLLVVVYALEPTIAADLWWHLKTGELIWTTGRVPHADVFSHTSSGQPWQVQEWLSEVIFYGLYHGLSADALVAFKVI